MLRVLKLNTTHKQIPIYCWYMNRYESGYAVTDFENKYTYKYFKTIKEAKQYIENELPE